MGLDDAFDYSTGGVFQPAKRRSDVETIRV